MQFHLGLIFKLLHNLFASEIPQGYVPQVQNAMPKVLNRVLMQEPE